MSIANTILDYAKDQAIKKICIVNRLSDRVTLSDDEILKVAKSVQKQLKEEFLYYYGYTGKLYYAGKKVKEPQDMWCMYLLDTSDEPGALGYHDANDLGQPQGKIFIDTIRRNRGQWSVTLSHEILEALSDPWGMANFFQDYTSGMKRLCAFENCDPVEADKYGYYKDSVLLSNFVTPYWMHPFNDTAELDKNIRYDLIGKLKSSFQTLAGCHQSYYYINGGPNGRSGWVSKNFQQISELKSNFLQEFKLGDEIEIYSAPQRGTNWHVMFKTPTEEMVKEFDIKREEILEAIDSAFNPHEGSRRDIRYKMSMEGGFQNLERNDKQIITKVFGDLKEESPLPVDQSFDLV